MNSLLILISLLIGVILAIVVTVVAVRAIRRGESVWKTIKKWVVGVLDSMFGIG